MITATTKEDTIQPFELLSSDNPIKNWELPRKLRYYGYWFTNSKGEWIFDDVRVKTPMAVIGNESKYYKLVVGAWKKINAYTELRKWSSKTEKPFNYSSKRRPKIHKEVVTELNKKWQEYIELRPHSKEWYKSKHLIKWESENRVLSSRQVVKLEKKNKTLIVGYNKTGKEVKTTLKKESDPNSAKLSGLPMQSETKQEQAYEKAVAEWIKDPEFRKNFYKEPTLSDTKGKNTCEVCGNSIIAPKGVANKRFCSKECRLIAQHNRFAKHRSDKKNLLWDWRIRERDKIDAEVIKVRKG